MSLADLPQKGIIAEHLPKAGCNYANTYRLTFDNLKIPKECLLGEEGKGFYAILDTLNPERIVGSATTVGTGKLAIKKAVEYANQREVFDGPIGKYQGIQFPLAAAYAKLECGWLAVLNAATLYDQKKDPKRVGDMANIAKFVCVDAAIQGVNAAMTTLGGWGYGKENHIERWYRELMVQQVAPVSQQMTLNYFAEHILGMPKSY